MFGQYKEIILNLDSKTHARDSERRRKRVIMPIVYFLAETVLFWLALSLLQLKFNLLEWNDWAIIVFIIGIIYSVAKTLHVFQRQKNYLDLDE